MSVEQSVPGIESPVESIRAIQQDRATQQAAIAPDGRKLVCAIYVKGTEIHVDSRVPQDTLLKVLGAAYVGAREKIHPEQVMVPERKLIVPGA